MKATLTTFTALTAVLAFTGAASAGMNLPMNQPNIAPMIRPDIVRPDIVPRIDMSRLAKQKARSSSRKDTKAAKSRRTTKTTRVGTAKAGRDKRLRSKHVRSKPLIANPPLPRPRPALAERLDDLASELRLANELARFGDLREMLGHQRGIDDGSLGGSSRRRPYEELGGLKPDEQETYEPENDQIWRPEAPESGSRPYNPHVDQGDGFERPQSGNRDGGDKPGMSRTPGSARAGAGLRVGGGETSEDGPAPQAQSVDDDGDQVESPLKDQEVYSCGPGCIGYRGQNQDGEKVSGRTESVDYASGRGTRTVETRARSDGQVVRQVTWNSPRGTTSRTVIVRRPNSQPNPEDGSFGESMPCPTGSRGCGEQADEVPWQDKVAQPGAHGGDGVQTFSPSVAERKHAVTNPVPPDSYAARTSGGGRGPRPIEHVTAPGGDDPDTPPGR